jgi:hypothetical protein
VAKPNFRRKQGEAIPLATAVGGLPLWQLDIVELTGHNIEARGREEVNQLLREGWRLLHIYTLKYEEEGVWRERPMAILGRIRQPQNDETDRKMTQGGPADKSTREKIGNGVSDHYDGISRRRLDTEKVHL